MSLVLMSPSTVSWFQVRSTARDSAVPRVPGSAVASVAMNASIVAMLGWIMPTPFAIPATITARGRASGPGSSRRTLAALGRVSVVISCSASVPNAASDAVRPLVARRVTGSRSRSTGKREPMSPVETASVSSRSTPRLAARRSPSSAWSRSPTSPVPAFAQPLVERMATVRPAAASRWARLRRTGAAGRRLVVNVPATLAGPFVVARIPRSRPPEALMPAATAPARKPAGRRTTSSTGGRSTSSGGSEVRESLDTLLMAPAAAARALAPRAARRGRPRPRHARNHFIQVVCRRRP